MSRKPDYCVQPGVRRCEECSLVSYGRDCFNNPISKPNKQPGQKAVRNSRRERSR